MEQRALRHEQFALQAVVLKKKKNTRKILGLLEAWFAMAGPQWRGQVN